jgi:hypothetical protein
MIERLPHVYLALMTLVAEYLESGVRFERVVELI